MDTIDTTRKNLLDVPRDGAPTEEIIRHKLAKILAESNLPVDPRADISTHPVWHDYTRAYHITKAKNPDDVKIVAVYTVSDAEWGEFVDSYSENEDNYGIAGEALAADGWTGRVYYQKPLREILQELLMESILDAPVSNHGILRGW